MLILIAAQTIDGFISRPDRPGTDFCSAADATFLSKTLKDFDSLIIGRRTYETIRERIQNSTTTQFLRKIITRAPDQFASEAKPGLIEFTSDSPQQVVSELRERGRGKTALLGGGEIYSQYLAAGLVDALWITVEPLLFGAGTPLLNKPLELSFELHSSTPLDENTLLLKYVPARQS